MAMSIPIPDDSNNNITSVSSSTHDFSKKKQSHLSSQWNTTTTTTIHQHHLDGSVGGEDKGFFTTASLSSSYRDIYLAFTQTLSSVVNERQQGEQCLHHYQSHLGFAPWLLHFLTMDHHLYQLEHLQHESLLLLQQLENVLGAAVIWLKNLIRGHWSSQKNNLKQTDRSTNNISQNSLSSFILLEADKLALKENLVPALAKAPFIVRPHLALAIHFILIHDYPNNWTFLNHQIYSFLSSNDLSMVHAGLLALYEIIKVYQWKSRTDRAPLNEILEAVFPCLLPLAHTLWTSLNTSLDTLWLFKFIFKIYHHSLVGDLAPIHVQTIHPWTHLSFLVLQLPLSIPTSTTVPASSLGFTSPIPLWKCHKWVLRIFSTLFTRYTNLHASTFRHVFWMSMKQRKVFAQSFTSKFFPTLFHHLLQLLQSTMMMVRMPSSLPEDAPFQIPPHALALRVWMTPLFMEMVRHPGIWTHFLYPSLTLVLSTLVFPLLQQHPDELTTLQEDPIAYVHTFLASTHAVGMDDHDDVGMAWQDQEAADSMEIDQDGHLGLSPRATALAWIHVCVTVRRDDMVPILAWWEQQLPTTVSATTPLPTVIHVDALFQFLQVVVEVLGPSFFVSAANTEGVVPWSLLAQCLACPSWPFLQATSITLLAWLHPVFPSLPSSASTLSSVLDTHSLLTYLLSLFQSSSTSPCVAVAIALVLPKFDWTHWVEKDPDLLRCVVTKVLEWTTTLDASEPLTLVLQDMVLRFPLQMQTLRPWIVHQLCDAMQQRLDQLPFLLSCLETTNEASLLSSSSEIPVQVQHMETSEFDGQTLSVPEVEAASSSRMADHMASLVHLMKTLRTFLTCASTVPKESWTELGRTELFPLFHRVLEIGVIEIYDDVWGLLSFLVVNTQCVDPWCWNWLVPTLSQLLLTHTDDLVTLGLVSLFQHLCIFTESLPSPTTSSPSSSTSAALHPCVLAAFTSLLHSPSLFDWVPLQAICRWLREWLWTPELPRLPSSIPVWFLDPPALPSDRPSLIMVILIWCAHSPVYEDAVPDWVWQALLDPYVCHLYLITPHAITAYLRSLVRVCSMCTQETVLYSWIVHSVAVLEKVLRFLVLGHIDSEALQGDSNHESGDKEEVRHPSSSRHSPPSHSPVPLVGLSPLDDQGDMDPWVTLGDHGEHDDFQQPGHAQHDDVWMDSDRKSDESHHPSKNSMEDLFEDDDEDPSRFASVQLVEYFVNAYQAWEINNQFVYHLFQTKCSPELEQLLKLAIKSVQQPSSSTS